MDGSFDRYFGRNPQELFESPVEDLIVDLESKVILEAHLQCAGHEMPLCLEDGAYFGPLTREICETKLQKDDEGW
jgi:DEAD/DEAH box helicase domain-containing protein